MGEFGRARLRYSILCKKDKLHVFFQQIIEGLTQLFFFFCWLRKEINGFSCSFYWILCGDGTAKGGG